MSGSLPALAAMATRQARSARWTPRIRVRDVAGACARQDRARDRGQRPDHLHDVLRRHAFYGRHVRMDVGAEKPSQGSRRAEERGGLPRIARPAAARLRVKSASACSAPLRSLRWACLRALRLFLDPCERAWYHGPYIRRGKPRRPHDVPSTHDPVSRRGRRHRSGLARPVTLRSITRANGRAASSTYRAPRAADGHPDLNGVWQAFVTANWDLEDHEAQAGPHPELSGAYGAGPAGQSIVEGGEIPYRPEALAKRKANVENRLKADVSDDKTWHALGDPEMKCYCPACRAPPTCRFRFRSCRARVPTSCSRTSSRAPRASFA